MARSLACASVVAFLFAGCAVGPNYRRPPVAAPENFRAAATPASTNSLASLQWWEIYKDATLQAPVRTALTNNYDLRLAIVRVEKAGAIAAETRSLFVPQFSYQGTVSSGRNEFLGRLIPFGTTGTRSGDAASATLATAWELDLWGRLRRLNESARAQLLATQEARNAVMLSLVSDVATAYFELLELDRRLEIARRATNSFGESLAIFRHRFQGGIASALDVSRAEAALASAAATVPDLRRQSQLKENQLNTLLGHNPGLIPRHFTLLEQPMPPEIPAGLPSALLERRPDLRQAESQLRSASAQIGVSLADFFPRIGLTTLLGKVSAELSAFTGGTANAWSVAATTSGPIFQGGALRARYRQAKAQWEEARLQYQQTALNAFREVSDALIAREELEAIRVQQARAVLAYEEAVKLSAERYLVGRAGYFELLEAQQELFPAENALAQTQLKQLLAIVQLYKALGGGWSEKTIADAKAS